MGKHWNENFYFHVYEVIVCVIWKDFIYFVEYKGELVLDFLDEKVINHMT